MLVPKIVCGEVNMKTKACRFYQQQAFVYELTPGDMIYYPARIIS